MTRLSSALLLLVMFALLFGCDKKSTAPEVTPTMSVSWYTEDETGGTFRVSFDVTTEDWSDGYGIRADVAYQTDLGHYGSMTDGLYLQSSLHGTMVVEGITRSQIWFPYSFQLLGPPDCSRLVASSSGTYRP